MNKITPFFSVRKELLTVFFLLSTWTLFAQYTRGIVSDGKPGANAPMHLQMGTRNFVIQDLYLQDLDTGYIRLTELDAKGNIMEARRFKSFVKNQSKLLGLFRKDSDRLTYVYSVGSGISSEWYMGTININTWTHSDQQIIIPNLVSNFSDFMEIQDSLVTLIVTDQNKLTRLCMSKLNPQQYTLFTMDTLSNFSANLRIGLTKDVFQNEFFVLRDNKTIYRYNVNGVVQKQCDYLSLSNNRRMFVYNQQILLADHNGIHVYNRYLDSITTVSYPNLLNVNTPYGVDMTTFEGWLFVSEMGQQKVNYIHRFNAQYDLLETANTDKLNQQKLSVNASGPFLLGTVDALNTDQYDFEGNLYGQNDQLISTVIYNFPSIDKIQPCQDFGARMDLLDDYTVTMGDGLNLVDYQQNFLNLSKGYGKKSSDKYQNLVFTISNGLLGFNGSNELDGFYGQFDTPATRMGPYTFQTDYDEKVNAKYSRFYYVDRHLLELHAWEQNYPNPNYQMPFGIEHWPAHGDVNKGQAQNLAPFHDQNGNGLYEPDLGDYPKIYGDKCFMKLLHYPDYQNNQQPIDVLVYLFTFDCDSSEFSNTVFYRTEFISRGGSLDSAFFVQYADFDIGNPIDDFIGSDVTNNMIYAYNSDLFDEPSGTYPGWDTLIPAAGLIVLDGMKKTNNGLDDAAGVSSGQSINGIGFGDGIADNERWGLTSSSYFTNGFSPQGDPSSLAEYYRVANGLTRAGDTIKINNIPIRHNYFGSSDPLFYSSGGVDHGNDWFETSQNLGGDRRISGSSGPGMLGTNDTLVILQALTSALDTSAQTLTSSVELLQQKAAQIQLYYRQNQTPCGGSFDPVRGDLAVKEVQQMQIELELYPNPNNGTFNVKTGAQIWSVLATDAAGRAIDVQLNKESYSLQQPSPGIYFVQVLTDKGSATKKMIVK